MSKGRIENPSLTVKPSKNMAEFVRTLPDSDKPVPAGIKALKERIRYIDARPPTEQKYLLNTRDHRFINSLTNHTERVLDCPGITDLQRDACLLNLEDLHWIHEQILVYNLHNEPPIFLHELFEDSLLIFPRNIEVPRNPVLEKRCEQLRAQQANRQYKSMTKNVDSVRQKYPEDTISYQVKQLNRQLIAVGQFVMSVLAGFAFGFIGLQYMFGNLDFGFRLLLGIICALVIALAELYFLAKKLNEEMMYEALAEEQTTKSKID